MYLGRGEKKEPMEFGQEQERVRKVIDSDAVFFNDNPGLLTPKRFAHPRLLLRDPLLPQPEFPFALWDIAPTSTEGKKILECFWPEGQPVDIIVYSIQQVQNEECAIGYVPGKKSMGFHGTPVENIDGIARNGFNTGKHGSLGKGVYVTHSFVKADSYTYKKLTPERELADARSERAMFLCAVKLGKLLSVDKGKMPTSFVDSADGITRKFNGHREIMLYDARRVKPAYVMRYAHINVPIITDAEKTRQLLFYSFLEDTSHVDIWSNKKPPIDSAVEFLGTQMNDPTRKDMYDAFVGLIKGEVKVSEIIAKVDALVVKLELTQAHRSFVTNTASFRQYVCRRALRLLTSDFRDHYLYYTVITLLGNIMAKHMHLDPAKQKELKDMFVEFLHKRKHPKAVRVDYAEKDYVPNEIANIIVTMTNYYTTPFEVYKSKLLENCKECSTL